jgi:dihydrofolate synthase/folylpolyglutamate synthase
VTPYVELLGRLLPARRFGVVLGLERIRALLDRLGAPDRRLGTVVHVGGTNGKGSTVAMIAALLRPGLRVATYTSPHLSCLRERITIDGELIHEATIVSAADRVRDAGGDELTFFEQLTAIAAVAIAEARVDVSVLEVGLGGRLDATNAIAAQVAVVTGAAMDHEAILGDTLAKIAAEKAGIFKPDQRIVIGASGEPAAIPMLRDAAARCSPHVTVIDDAAIARVPPVALPGAHQRRNAAAALAAIEQLEALGVARIGDAARRAALASVQHPGRFEVIGDVILDGAHNPHGAAALADTLRELGIRPVLVIAMSADKDAAAIARVLAPCVRAVIATRFQQDRSLAPDQLAARFADLLLDDGVLSPHDVSLEHAPDLAAGLAAARRHGAPILVAGSLFLVGEARVLLLGAPADPFVVSDPAASAPTARP